MPLQTVTLEPLVQGERSAASFRLPGKPGMRTESRITALL